MAKQANPFDNEIILEAALRQDDEKAWEYLYKQNWPSARNFVMTHGGDEDDAKEVYQAALVRLHEKLHDPYFVLEDKTGRKVKVSTYLLSIVKYKWLSEARKRGKHVPYEPDPLYNERDDTDADADPLDDVPFPIVEGVENPFEEKNIPSIDEVLEYIRNMDNPCRDLLLDHYFAGISFEEMTEENDEKAGTIRKRAFACREKVKKYFLGKQ